MIEALIDRLVDQSVALRPAFAYVAVPRWCDIETQTRRTLAEHARLEGLELCSVFVDRVGESPRGFAAMREVLRRRADVRTVVLPDLGHVAHITAVARLSQAGLARYLGTAVLVVTTAPVAASSARRHR